MTAHALEIYEGLLESLPLDVESLLRFKFPEPVQRRFAELVDRSREGALTPDENDEMQRYLAAEALVRVLKAKALKNRPAT